MKRKHFLSRLNIFIFPLLAVLLAAAVYSDNREVFANPEASMYTYLDSLRYGKIGYGSESASVGNNISFDQLEIGDIVLGGYPGCAYGRFSHAAIYIGNGNVIEGYLDTGITMNSVKHFWDYSEIALLRVEAAEEVKLAAAQYAKQNKGDIFFALAFKPGNRIWNCTKIIWQSYVKQGVELDSAGDIWVAPDSFYNSPQVKILEERGNLK
ncbi:MAG TPA: YiiX/YebB-like N1pC/P60 family cysteine hydrolase [Syntrophomonadaceae bacterium]|nr:YiiX/YebB-like N1pC/P60 family cysteine hydrolase [Syntrophomonadaceae bacterium]HPR93194.1 YiiX/YebB-like N1pC/P60 family cysteine hydrolase [Syntrophomonadaceae bacterium]